MPTLVLIRHATAETFAASDHERHLTDAGELQAAAVGSMLAAAAVSPDLAYVSSARRTRETWQAMARSAGWRIEAHVDTSLYGAEEAGVLELLRVTEPDMGTVVVVGHNPTVGALVQLLDDGDGPASAAALSGFPTASFAVFSVADWSELGPMSARLERCDRGRG